MILSEQSPPPSSVLDATVAEMALKQKDAPVDYRTSDYLRTGTKAESQAGEARIFVGLKVVSTRFEVIHVL